MPRAAGHICTGLYLAVPLLFRPIIPSQMEEKEEEEEEEEEGKEEEE